MMRCRSLHRLRSYLLPAIAAIFLAVGPMACSSSGEEAPNPALENAASGEENSEGNASNNAASANTANGNAEAANANADAAKPEGEASASNNPIGNELNNAIANDKPATPTAEASPDNGGAINAEANNAFGGAPAGGGDAAASASGDAAAVNTSQAADASAGNPFGAESAAPPAPTNAGGFDTSASAPANTAPGTGSLDSAGASPTDAAAAGAAAPTDGSAAPTSGAPTSTEVVPTEAAASTGPKSLPEPGSKMAYFVMRGDTLGSVAQKIYGSRKKWKALQTENRIADANKIYPGDVIYFTLDEASRAFAEKYEMGSRQNYTVARGDSLARLAAKFYGTQGAWRALWKENPQINNPDRIRVGMVLSYRAATKVALRDEALEEVADEDDDNVSEDDQSEAADESGVADESGFVSGQLTAGLE